MNEITSAWDPGSQLSTLCIQKFTWLHAGGCWATTKRNTRCFPSRKWRRYLAVTTKMNNTRVTNAVSETILDIQNGWKMIWVNSFLEALSQAMAKERAENAKRQAGMISRYELLLIFKVSVRLNWRKPSRMPKMILAGFVKAHHQLNQWHQLLLQNVELAVPHHNQPRNNLGLVMVNLLPRLLHTLLAVEPLRRRLASVTLWQNCNFWTCIAGPSANTGGKASSVAKTVWEKTYG